MLKCFVDLLACPSDFYFGLPNVPSTTSTPLPGTKHHLSYHLSHTSVYSPTLKVRVLIVHSICTQCLIVLPIPYILSRIPISVVLVSSFPLSSHRPLPSAFQCLEEFFHAFLNHYLLMALEHSSITSLSLVTERTSGGQPSSDSSED